MSSLICINACSLLLGKNFTGVSMITRKKHVFPLGNRNVLVLQEFAMRPSQWRIKNIFSLRTITTSPEVREILRVRFKLIHKCPRSLELELVTSSASCETDFFIVTQFLSFALNTIMLWLKVYVSTVLLTYGKRLDCIGNS